MRIKSKFIALAMVGIAALSATGCSKTLSCQDGATTRKIKITNGTKTYSNGVIDGFRNGCATGTWIKWNTTQYYNAETTNAATNPNNFLLFTCTANHLKQSSTSSEETYVLYMNGIINYSGTSDISRINLSGYDYT